MADLFFRTNGLNQFIGDLLRIAVLNPDPVNARDLGQLVKQLRKHLLSVQIHAVQGSLLRYQNQLADTLVCQLVCLF